MKVEILTTPACANCSVVERMLDEMGIQYQVIDVTEKPEYLQKYQNTSKFCTMNCKKIWQKLYCI